MFDAGAIQAHLDVETSQFDRKLTAAEERVKSFERGRHEIRISAVFDNASLGRARQMFTQLDNQLSREAMQRLRSSPQGSVLGSINALFSPHPVTGGPSASQAASGGLLGRMVRSQGGGLPGGTTGVSSVLLGQAAGTAPGGTARVRLDQSSISDIGSAVSGSLPTTPSGPDPGVTRNATTALRSAQASERAADSSRDAARSAASAARDSDSSTRSFLRGFLGIGGGGGRGGVSFPLGGGGGGDRRATGFISGRAGPFTAGLAGGIGPGILGIGGIRAGLAGLAATGVAALPALAAGGATLGLLGAGAGIIGAGAKTLIGSKNTKADPNAQGPLFNQAQQIGDQLKAAMRQAAGGMLEPLKQAFGQLPGIIRQVTPLLRQLFAGAGTLIEPLLHSINDLAHMVLPGLAQALRAVAPLVRPLLDGFGRLIQGILPGLVTLLHAAGPAISALAAGLADIGGGLGKMFSQFAPVIRASSTILAALLDVISGLFPIIGTLASVFAKALAPIFVQLAGIIQSLLPFLVTLGKLFASLAGAILGDLVAAFGAVAQLLKDIAPALNTFAQAFSGVFTVLENSGVFAIIGDALEALVKPLATMISQLLHGLTPILPPLITFISQLSSILIQGLSAAIAALLPPLTRLALVVLQAIVQLLPVVLPLFLSLTRIVTAAFVRVVTDLAAALDFVIRSIPPRALRDIALGFIAIWAAVKAGGIISAVSNPVGLITLAVAALVIGIVELAKHWHQVWTNIRNWANDAWHFLNGVFRNHIVQDILAVWSLGLVPLAEHWRSVWRSIQRWTDDVRIWLHHVFGTDIANFFTRTIPGWLGQLGSRLSGFWRATEGGFRDLAGWLHRVFGTDIANFFTRTVPGWFSTSVNKIGQFWSGLRGVVLSPVKWVFQHVLDPLATGFDWITSHLGLGHPIPTPLVKGWARGGRIKGGIPGVDSVLGLLQEDEVVIPRHMVKAGMIDHLRGMLPGFQAGGRVRVGQPPPVNLHTGAGSDIRGNPLGGLLHKIEDMGRIGAALATGNAQALVNAFSDFTGIRVPGAGGDMAKVLGRIPRTIVSDIAHWLMGHAGFGMDGSAIVRDAMHWLGKIPYVWGGTSVPGGADCSGFTQTIYGRHGIHAPRTSEAQGAWVRHSGPVPGALAFYHSLAGGPDPGHVAIVRNMNQVISQGGGMGPQLIGIRALPLLWMGVPPGGLKQGIANVAATGSVQQFARRMVDATWGDAYWPYFADIVRHEDQSWSPTATNPLSGAYGIPQALPGSKMASAGADWRTNPYTQVRWMIGYLKSRWGNPLNADINEIKNHWYDKGGVIREPVIGFGMKSGDRYGFAMNGVPELVTPAGGGASPAIGTVVIQLPEGQTVARALTDLDFWLSVSRQQGWAGGMPGG